MKAILMSIRPEWLELILMGEKKDEARITCPNRELPIEVYFYCTKRNGYLHSGKVVAKATIDRVRRIFKHQLLRYPKRYVSESCLTGKELFEYGSKLYVNLWHIYDLVIFDKPKELSEFGVKRPPQSWRYVEVEG